MHRQTLTSKTTLMIVCLIITFIFTTGCLSSVSATQISTPNLQAAASPDPSSKYKPKEQVHIRPMQGDFKDELAAEHINDFYVISKYSRSGVFLQDEIDTCDKIVQQQNKKTAISYEQLYEVKDSILCDGLYWVHITGYQVDDWVWESSLSTSKVPPEGLSFILDSDANCGQYLVFKSCLPRDLWKSIDETGNTTIDGQPVEFSIKDIRLRSEMTEFGYDKLFTYIDFMIRNTGDASIDVNISKLVEIINDWSLYPALRTYEDTIRSSRLYLKDYDIVHIEKGQLKEFSTKWQPSVGRSPYGKLLISVNSSITEIGMAIVHKSGSLFYFYENE